MGKDLIVLVSGKGKYFANKEQYDRIETEGKALFQLLKEKKDVEFSKNLKALHEYIVGECRQVEVFRNAELIVPPVTCDPARLREVMGI
uniref:Uncharacterized protein n=1 Tax=Candidatus Methanomethylicus mesodigestus TaxID=1867258 RepID=A0A7C3F6C0_9CREN